VKYHTPDMQAKLKGRLYIFNEAEDFQTMAGRWL
jgi:hypothetical protein